MAIIQCPQGHFYDNAKHASCPNCTVGGTHWDSGEQKTVSLAEMEYAKHEIRLTAQKPAGVRGQWDDQKTVSLSPGGQAALFVGWLVCVKGPMRGMDYKLYPGFNRIGRDLACDVCVQDPTVSAGNHCSVVYDAKSNQFYLVPGQGTLTYLDGQNVADAAPLTEGVRIGLGSSELVLIPFCKGDRTWQM